MADDLKIFISWSGDLSREITKVIRRWIPKIFDRVDPWMSDIDVEAGTRALQLIEESLNESSFGIIVVTTANQDSTWLNFEAGALSKRFDNSLARVVPVLVNFDDFYQITGPIRQFQGVMLNRDGMRKLLQSICQVTGAEWTDVESRFDWSWKDFSAEIDIVKKKIENQPAPPEFDPKIALLDIMRRLDQIEPPMIAIRDSPSGVLARNRRHFAFDPKATTDSVQQYLAEAGIQFTKVNVNLGPDPTAHVYLKHNLKTESIDIFRRAIEREPLDIEVSFHPPSGDESSSNSPNSSE
ncbi:hypothetical protein AS590_25865 [Prescottella equi]|uniref:toll/interleukin-1 receptor domain-containing protein n=1 Tax=Rhodococcus erythropolis TaxID=1833 RepID=UPI00080B9C6B|nr:toll/interleukin-1 receptor domain-containing protein [Rhodococcus erythropolis]MCZ4570351.1 toll/interleukin-1 receptor domain-containing protein [Rhodococcus erythropolis]OCC19424.1 hypothetical protein AS590_25865 [Prescottella equi]